MSKINMVQLQNLSKLIRYYIIEATTKAGSGHLTSSLSATDLMTALFFGSVLHFDVDNPQNPANDHVIFSKGHAAPLLYSLWTAAGKVSEAELLTLRQFGSVLEGHPTMRFPYTEAATGSLGQGLSVGVGLALAAKYVDKSLARTFVLLGDSEMSEGSVWEALQIASHYQLDNLVAILDVNRLGQRGETMYGHNLSVYQKRLKSFGWEIIVVDGHNLNKILASFSRALKIKGRPVAIIAKTIKGKGVKMVENKNGWHGKTLSSEEAQKAIKDLGLIDKKLKGEIIKPKEDFKKVILSKEKKEISPILYKLGEKKATREAYGEALLKIFSQHPEMVVLDAEVSNSTYAEIFKQVHPQRFFEMFIAEQNMVGTAVGLSRAGYLPFVSTFAAFFSRAFDQIRMARYSESNIKFCGSHAGVSIGEDGPSQMGLEDIALFRSILDLVVLYPADAVATEKLVKVMAGQKGLAYLRTTRSATEIIYSEKEEFIIGGSKVLRTTGASDAVTLIGAGITVFECLKAQEILQKEGINARVIDLYSIKPLDIKTLTKAAQETKALIVVEDHYEAGGIAEAVRTALGYLAGKVISLAVRKMPKSGKPAELMDYEEISAEAIIKRVKLI